MESREWSHGDKYGPYGGCFKVPLLWLSHFNVNEIYNPLMIDTGRTV